LRAARRGTFSWSARLLKKGYRYFSEGIAGLGAAVLYLSLWAGWHYYQLFPQSAAFWMMIVVTAVTAAGALRRDSQRIALIALLGGVLTPWLVSTGENHEITLFTYLAILGAGMLALGRRRDWKALAPIQFGFTLIYFWEWYERFCADDELFPTFFFATLFLLIFTALPVLHSRQEAGLSNLDALIFFSNFFAYYLALRAMLWPERRWALTLSVLALAAAHLAAERAVPGVKGPGNILARVLFAGLALTFATLAIPIRLELSAAGLPPCADRRSPINRIRIAGFWRGCGRCEYLLARRHFARSLGSLWANAFARRDGPRARATTHAFHALAGVCARVHRGGFPGKVSHAALAGAGPARDRDRQGFHLRPFLSPALLPNLVVPIPWIRAAPNFILLPALPDGPRRRLEITPGHRILRF
jgi:Predicted membrane protein (DUF2339)